MRPELIAPITEGEEVGQISIRLEDAEIANRGLIALETVPEAGFFGRTWDGMRCGSVVYSVMIDGIDLSTRWRRGPAGNTA